MSKYLRHKIHWWRLRTAWYRKKLRLSQPPYFINLEPTGFCNLHCTVCSYSQRRGKGYLRPELAYRVMTDAADFGVSQVRFFLAGEPLFHPHLGEFLTFAHQRGLLTQIHTNATILDEKHSRILLDAGLDSLSLSFDGETAEDYEAIRVGSKFDKTLANIITFLELKKKSGQKVPRVTFQVIKPFLPGSQFVPKLTHEFKAKFKGLPIDNFRVIYPFTWPGQDKKEFVRPTGKKTFPCPILWQSLSVAWDGRVLGCCGDLNGMLTLGDVHTDRLRDIWNGDTLIAMRRAHIENKFKSLALCCDCDIVYIRAHPAIRDLKDLLTGKWQAI
ncbi:MAG: radical SAM protein [bacterium]|nr:radical SAM protein [bacterium]